MEIPKTKKLEEGEIYFLKSQDDLRRVVVKAVYVVKPYPLESDNGGSSVGEAVRAIKFTPKKNERYAQGLWRWGSYINVCPLERDFVKVGVWLPSGDIEKAKRVASPRDLVEKLGKEDFGIFMDTLDHINIGPRWVKSSD